MKYARIVRLFADKLQISYDDALAFFYDSDTYRLISNGVADIHCLSDELLMEWNEQGVDGKIFHALS